MHVFGALPSAVMLQASGCTAANINGHMKVRSDFDGCFLFVCLFVCFVLFEGGYIGTFMHFEKGL